MKELETVLDAGGVEYSGCLHRKKLPDSDWRRSVESRMPFLGASPSEIDHCHSPPRQRVGHRRLDRALNRF